MSDDEALLQSILANPDDEATRLVYADWLEERGESDRAEFIRLQCDLAKLAERHPRGDELRARARALIARHPGEWMQQVGVAMTWENTIAVFKWRLAETIAWCRHRRVVELRTPALEPAPLMGQYVSSWGRQVWRSPSIRERQVTVNTLANRRTQMLVEGGGRLTDDLEGGRLLLFDPDGTLSDEAARPESAGFFDGHNTPAWDTWVWYAEDQNPQESSWTMFASYVVAWVPPHVLELADAGIRVNPEECIRWASEVDTTLTRRLRLAGLLA